jgi:hypothetical protein
VLTIKEFLCTEEGFEKDLNPAFYGKLHKDNKECYIRCDEVFGRQ